MANLYRELSGLSDSALKKAGLKRSDLPALVVRTLRLIEVSNGRTAKRRSPAVKRTTTKRKAAKRTSGRGARA
jgi:hypothetical protein